MYQNTKVEYFSLADEAFPRLLEDLRKARHYIFMEYFIVTEGVMWDSIKAILKEKAAAGVEVRFAYDDLGSVGCLPKNFRKELAAAGIHVLTFNPFRPALSAVMNNRNHRKITVLDGYIAYTGGFNLADEYINQKQRFGHWKDTGLRLYGEGVYSLTLMCLELWNAFYNTNDNCKKYLPHRYHPEPFPTDGYVQPYCNSPFENETLAQDIYLDLLYQAKEDVSKRQVFCILKECWIWQSRSIQNSEFLHWKRRIPCTRCRRIPTGSCGISGTVQRLAVTCPICRTIRT